MTPFPSSGDAPAGGVTFSRARESNQRARIGGSPLYTPFFLGIRGGGVIGSRGSGLASPPLVLPLVCGYWGVGGSLG